MLGVHKCHSGDNGVNRNNEAILGGQMSPIHSNKTLRQLRAYATELTEELAEHGKNYHIEVYSIASQPRAYGATMFLQDEERRYIDIYGDYDTVKDVINAYKKEIINAK